MPSAHFGRDRISFRSSSFKFMTRHTMNNMVFKAYPCSIPIVVFKYLLNALITPETYSEPCWASKIEYFGKIDHCWQSVIKIFRCNCFFTDYLIANTCFVPPRLATFYTGMCSFSLPQVPSIRVIVRAFLNTKSSKLS